MTGSDSVQIPQYVKNVLNCLKNGGYEGYMVGGCVRDSIMGCTPNDYDITTNATPEEMLICFEGWRVIPTGLKHGTVTVISDGNNIEVTTYRVDGEYEDNRHPRQVTFTSRLEDDLARRDFTVNAMAMDAEGNICDPFGGMADIRNRVMRSVGDSSVRFGEDGLRILRCLRFASVLGFEIELDTAEKVHHCRHLLDNISKERIMTELKKLLCGMSAPRICSEFGDVICQILPELSEAYDGDEISVRLDRAYIDIYVRLALLLLPLGADGAGRALRRLKCDNMTYDRVKLLISEADLPENTDRITLKKYLSRMDGDSFVMLTHFVSAIDGKDRSVLRHMSDKIVASGECVSIPQLAVSGSDIITLGAVGVQIGEILKKLLDSVICETLPNSKDLLLDKAKELLDKLGNV